LCNTAIVKGHATMTEFLETLFNPNLPFLRNALLAGILASIPLGLVGTHVVLRRIGYLAAAISHSILGGIGISIYLKHSLGWDWLHPVYGAIATAIIASFLINYIQTKAAAREDALIGAIWVTGMAIGLLCFELTPAYVDPMSYLFGNILLIGNAELVTTLVLGLIVSICLIRYHKELIAIAFDPEFTELRGIHVKHWNLLLLILTSLTIVLMVNLVGIVLVIALLTLPPALAMHKKTSAGMLLLKSVITCMLLISFGIILSYTTDISTGPIVIGLTGITYLMSLIRG